MSLTSLLLALLSEAFTQNFRPTIHYSELTVTPNLTLILTVTMTLTQSQTHSN